MRGFEMEPDLVAGLATSTVAGEELVRKLSGAKALNLLAPHSIPELRDMLQAVIPKLRD